MHHEDGDDDDDDGNVHNNSEVNDNCNFHVDDDHDAWVSRQETIQTAKRAWPSQGATIGATMLMMTATTSMTVLMTMTMTEAKSATTTTVCICATKPVPNGGDSSGVLHADGSVKRVRYVDVIEYPH